MILAIKTCSLKDFNLRMPPHLLKVISKSRTGSLAILTNSSNTLYSNLMNIKLLKLSQVLDQDEVSPSDIQTSALIK